MRNVDGSTGLAEVVMAEPLSETRARNLENYSTMAKRVPQKPKLSLEEKRTDKYSSK